MPLLAALVEKSTEQGVELKGSVAIEISTCSSRTIRGYTLVAAICDEAAFWTDENSAEPDREVLAALRPAMSTIPGAILLVASSPIPEREFSGTPTSAISAATVTPVLVIQAPTLKMNPNVPAAVIEDARIADPQSAAAEYDAQFRTDVETFISREAIDACTSRGVLERPPVAGVRYRAFTDPSGGSSDAMTLAIAHAEKDGTATLDCTVTRQPPFSPEQVVADFAMFLRRYGCSSVTGDHFGGEWPREQFRKHGITYITSPLPKRDLYLGVLPLINSGKADLLDNPRIVGEFVGLERRQARGGREIIDHPLNGHDDVVNSVAGALYLAAAGAAKARLVHLAPVAVGGAADAPAPGTAPPVEFGGTSSPFTLSDMPPGMMGGPPRGDGSPW